MQKLNSYCLSRRGHLHVYTKLDYTVGLWIVLSPELVAHVIRHFVVFTFTTVHRDPLQLVDTTFHDHTPQLSLQRLSFATE